MSLQAQHNTNNRIVLLFDLDCFYAQCERVRLGLDVQVCLALLQWNSVLAVTYPAREFGIKRGDSWEAVDTKSKGECWAIHLQVLRKQQQEDTTNNATATATATATPEQQQDNTNTPEEEEEFDNIQQAFEKIYNLSKEEQLECQKKERGVRRFYHEGKACLERYRLVSMRIFSVVLSSLEQRLGKDQFVLERASIDEFYLDITKYCYDNNSHTKLEGEDIMNHKTVVVGGHDSNHNNNNNDPIHYALQHACQVSHWIREDLWNILGFTMSAGISTNKMMAKLAATYGKPNGQAVSHPDSFGYVMDETKIRKVRHFGGKLGQQVLKTVLSHKDENATMGDLRHVPLPALQQHFSRETAQFIFDACRGGDKEAVKETTGALVKSITAFKSFPATGNRSEIQQWVVLLAGEVTSRVANDTARNCRYPKSCTLNYTFYTTPSGQRPNGVNSTRSQRQSRSSRLIYPKPSNNNSSSKAQELVQQAMEKLIPILQQHPLRGVGLSASNFEARGQPPEGVASIDNFFSKKTADSPSQPPKQSPSLQTKPQKRPADIHSLFPPTQQLEPANSVSVDQPKESSSTKHTPMTSLTSSTTSRSSLPLGSNVTQGHAVLLDKDLELARNLQASYDRENYVLSTAKKGPAKKKVRRIDTFFCKR